MSIDISEELKRIFLLQEEYLGNNKPANKQEPLVSVSVATYQHVDYIGQCLDGILKQQTDFSYEIIVGEDGSVDGTRDICIDYAEKYPDKIRLFLRDRSLSQHYENGKIVCRFNGIWCRMSCRGKYIALCEGDDYWTDPFKLQKQVEFLEKNKQYSICFHRVNVVDEEGMLLWSSKIRRKSSITQKDFIINNDLEASTCSMVFRRELNSDKVPFWFDRVHAGDRFLKTHLMDQGDAFIMKDIMACYRKHGGGIWTSLKWDVLKAKRESDTEVMIQLYGNKYPKMISYIRDTHTYQFIVYYIRDEKIRDAWAHFLEVFKHPNFIWIHRVDILKTFVKLTIASLKYYPTKR